MIIAAGLQVSRGIPIPGADLEKGVLLALPFLKAANFDEEIEIGERVIVIGGGNVAIDVARCALRQDNVKEVNLTCLESGVEMPAFPWEIEEAVEEGIQINCSRGPVQIFHEDGEITGLEVQECTAVFDAEGRFNPSFNCENKDVIPGDTVIFAIGQGSELSFLKDTKVDVDERGRLQFDRTTYATSEEGVFACGEVITGPGSAIGSISTGHEVAISVDRYLQGEDLIEGRPPEPEVTEEYIDYPDLDVMGIEEERLRRPMPMLSPDERKVNFNQVEMGFTKEDSIKEAERCLRCHSGVCVGCQMCARACPDYIIEVDRTAAGNVDRKVQEWNLALSNCMFCGLCVEACPTNTLRFSKEFELDMADREAAEYDKTWMMRNLSSQDESLSSYGAQSDKE